MDNKTPEKKAYNKPEITEIGNINEVILSGGIYGSYDGSYSSNGMKYATFDPSSVA